MAKAKVGPAGIEYIQGSLMKPKKKDGHKCGNYLIATHRTAATQSDECQRLYSRTADAYQRSTPVSTNERAARVRFVAVGTAVRARMDDLQHIAQDQQAFLAQKDQPYGKKTLKAYLWSVCGDEYDAQQG